MTDSGKPAGTLSLHRECEGELVAQGRKIAVDLEPGLYWLTAEANPEFLAPASSELRGIEIVWDLQAPGTMDCPDGIAPRNLPLAGAEAVPGDWEQPPQSTSLSDINDDGREDWAYVYVVNHNQLATRVSVSRPYPECERVVMDRLGKGRVRPAQRGRAWPSFEFTSYILNPDNEGGRVFVHERVQYDVVKRRYDEATTLGCSERGFMKERVRSCEGALGI